MADFYEIYHNESLLEELDRGQEPRGDEILIDQLEATLVSSPPGRIVDIGCGHGAHTFALADAFPDALVVGIDPHRESLQAALSERNSDDQERIGFIPGTIEALPLEDDSTDLIWCFDMLCHCEEPAAALLECHRILAPGGTLLLSTAVTTSLMDPATWNTLAPIGIHRPSMEQTTLDALLKSIGFQVTSQENFTSEFLERIEKEDPGRVSSDIIRLARLRRNPGHWKKNLGYQLFPLVQAMLTYNLAVLCGKINYYTWQVRK